MARNFWRAIALVLVALAPCGLQGQSFLLEGADHVAVGESGFPAPPDATGSDQVGFVLTNRAEVERILRRGYRALDEGRTLGTDTVTLWLQADEEGRVI